jgi:hypothetical protein
MSVSDELLIAIELIKLLRANVNIVHEGRGATATDVQDERAAVPISALVLLSAYRA